MIRYALACHAGHPFDSWFPSAEAFEEQAATGLVVCPHCGSARVEKQIMAPSVARTDRAAGPPEATAQPDPTPDSAEQKSAPSVPTPAPALRAPQPQPVALLSDHQKQVRAALKAFRAFVSSNAEDVGRGFAAEARAIHGGDAPERFIVGQADRDEVAELIEEGVPIAPLPALPEDLN